MTWVGAGASMVEYEQRIGPESKANPDGSRADRFEKTGKLTQ